MLNKSIKVSFSNPEFKVGYKFIYDNKEWVVREVLEANAQQLRKIASHEGDEDIVSLKSLIERTAEKSFIDLSSK